jgi:hypothetical protein
MWVMSNLVSVHLEMVLVLVQDRCTILRRTYKSFWTNSIVLLGDETEVEARFSPFGDSANLDTK